MSERSYVDELEAKLAEVESKYAELLSYLPEVPTQPYEKELAMEVQKLREANKLLMDGLKFYADQDNWTLSTAQSCSAMIGPDDHYVISNTSKFVAGDVARKAIAQARQITEGGVCQEKE